jgi:formylglycine-generating enzyme required for sulfatase activity
MVPIPGGELTIAEPGEGSRVKTISIAPFWMAKTELTFDAFDVFVYALDQPDPSTPAPLDGVTRPSKPYIPPDKGFGHQGYPAIGMSYRNAAEFCQWLSKKTGRAYRLPTEAEWEFACRAGSSSPWFFGDSAAGLEDYAWFRGTTDNTTKPVGQKKPNSFGLLDVLGNVQEWCQGVDGKPVTRGGSFRDPADRVTAAVRVPPSAAWNASDPQVPKSQWWMVDCAFVGFRVVCQP